MALASIDTDLPGSSGLASLALELWPPWGTWHGWIRQIETREATLGPVRPPLDPLGHPLASLGPPLGLPCTAPRGTPRACRSIRWDVLIGIGVATALAP